LTEGWSSISSRQVALLNMRIGTPDGDVSSATVARRAVLACAIFADLSP